MILVAYNVQFSMNNNAQQLTVIYLFKTMFGEFTPFIACLFVSLLCFSTFVMITGAGARLLASMAEDRRLPKILAKKNKTQAPIMGIFIIALFQFTTFTLNYFGVFTDVFMVNWANTFFVANILIVLLGGLRVAPTWGLKSIIIFVGITFLFLSSFMSPVAVMIVVGLTAWHCVSGGVKMYDK